MAALPEMFFLLSLFDSCSVLQPIICARFGSTYTTITYMCDHLINVYFPSNSMPHESSDLLYLIVYFCVPCVDPSTWDEDGMQQLSVG